MCAWLHVPFPFSALFDESNHPVVFSEYAWKSTLPNTGSQRIQPNEVQIPQVFVGVRMHRVRVRMRRLHLSLERSVWQDHAGEKSVSVPHGWCAGHEDGGRKNEEGAEEGRGE